jgi:hypothetical protein
VQQCWQFNIFYHINLGGRSIHRQVIRTGLNLLTLWAAGDGKIWVLEMWQAVGTIRFFLMYVWICMDLFVSIWDGMTKIKIPNLRCLRHLLVLLELRWVGVHLTCFAGIETVGFRPPQKYHPCRRLQNSFDPNASTKLIRAVLSCNSRVSDLDFKGQFKCRGRNGWLLEAYLVCIIKSLFNAIYSYLFQNPKPR